MDSPSLEILRTQMDTVNCCGWPCPSRAWMHCSLDVSYTGTTTSLPQFEGLVESRKLSCSLQSFMIYFPSLLLRTSHTLNLFLMSLSDLWTAVLWASWLSFTMAQLDYGWTVPSVPNVFNWAKRIRNIIVGLSWTMLTLESLCVRLPQGIPPSLCQTFGISNPTLK